MQEAVERLTSDVKLSTASTVSSACRQALAAAADNDRIIIFGSFYTVAEAMQFFALQYQ
jgi:dihydrofolate synthase/folylpolyglutamate synthase